MLVPGPPVRIHARIGGHRNGSRGKEGTRKRSAGRTRGGIKGGGRERRRGGEGEEKEKEPAKGKRGRLGAKRETRRRGGGTTKTRSITWHSIFVALLPLRVLLQISTSLLPTVLWYTLSPIQPATLSFPTVQLLSFPIGGNFFHDKKKCDMSEWIHRPSLLCCLHRELKHHILPRQPAINGRK